MSGAGTKAVNAGSAVADNVGATAYAGTTVVNAGSAVPDVGVRDSGGTKAVNAANVVSDNVGVRERTGTKAVNVGDTVTEKSDVIGSAVSDIVGVAKDGSAAPDTAGSAGAVVETGTEVENVGSPETGAVAETGTVPESAVADLGATMENASSVMKQRAMTENADSARLPAVTENAGSQLPAENAGDVWKMRGSTAPSLIALSDTSDSAMLSTGNGVPTKSVMRSGDQRVIGQREEGRSLWR